MAGPTQQALDWSAQTDAEDSADCEAAELLRHPDGSEWLQKLARTIEGEIVPRLMLAHRAMDLPATTAIGPDEVAEFSRQLLERDVADLRAFVDGQRARGHALESIYLNLLAPAARHLGAMWESDLCDFTQVAVGLCRLQQVVHQLGSAFCADAAPGPSSPRVALTVTAGEQHTFGLIVVAEFFRRDGWDVLDELSGKIDDLARLLRVDWFDVLGVSVSGETRIDAAAHLIGVLRRASRNKQLRVVVGGSEIVRQPHLLTQLGADACAYDGRDAVEQANALLASIAPARARGKAVLRSN